MRLQAKFTAVFAFAALVPILGAWGMIRWSIRRTYRDAAARVLEDARRAGDAQFRQLGHGIEEAVSALAAADDRDVQELLLALGKNSFDDDRQNELAHRAPSLMHERGLDVLYILDPHGRILACGHAPGRAQETEPQVLGRADQFPGRPLLVADEIMDGGRLTPALVLEAARRVRAHGAEVVVVAGRKVARILDPLRQQGRLAARIVAPEAEPDDSDWSRMRRYPSQTLALAGADRVVRAHLQLAVTDEDLRHVLDGLTQASTLLAGGALILALVLGGFVARRITRPVRELARGAAAVARGELDVKLEVTSRHDELWDLLRAFDRMVEELARSKEQLVLAERVAAWREIARRLAHEIKNPLTPIQMSIETMRRTKDRPDKFEEMFDEGTRTILAEVARLKKIVQEFSDFARLPKPTLEPTDVGEVARQALALYQGGTVPVRAELPERPLPQVMADKQQLQQVILNLLENARDAVSRKGAGEIIVRARQSGGAVELEVEDTGVGLSESVRERLFVPYFTTKDSGTGLGLAIVHRIVTDHGGRVTARGAEGQGATFTISLPA